MEICKAKEMLKERVKMVQEEKVVGKIDRKLIPKTKSKKSVLKDKEEMEETEAENEFQCRRCNKKHGPRECPAFRKKCNRCGKLNHFEAACRLKRIQEIEDLQDEENLTIELVNIVKGKIHQIGVVA